MTTSRVKGFDNHVSQDLIDSGGLYVPDLTRLRDAVELSDPPEISHLKALEIGTPIVALAFSERLKVVTGFEPFPEKTIDAKRSAHNVGFGRLTKRVGLGANPKIKTAIGVAVKPFDDPETALREMRGYGILEKLGIETFSSVGIFPARNGTHYVSMTQKRQDLQSLDGDLWVVGGRVMTPTEAEIAQRNAKTVREISEKMAFIHAKGFFHPDGQIKNWAVTPDGTVGIIDTENFKQVGIGNIDAPQLAWEDIDKLVKSLVVESKDDDGKMFGVGMFAGMPLDQLRRSVKDMIIIPYIEALVDNIPDDDMQTYGHIENLVETIQNRFFHQEQEWPSHLVGLQQVAFSH